MRQPPSGIWKNQNQRAPTSGYLKKPESKSYRQFWLFQNPQRTARFHERTGGVLCGYLTFSRLWEPRLYFGTGYLFFCSVYRGCEHLEPPWYPDGVLWCSFLCPPNTGNNHCVHNKQARCTSRRASRRWNGIFFGWRWVHEMYVGARNPGCHKSWEKNSKELEKTLGFLDFCVL